MLHDQIRRLCGVDLLEDHAGAALRDPVDDRVNQTAGTAPIGPKIEDGDGRLAWVRCHFIDPGHPPSSGLIGRTRGAPFQVLGEFVVGRLRELHDRAKTLGGD